MFYLGIDVAKAKLDCCVVLENGKNKTKAVVNSKSGVGDLLAWLDKHKITPVHAVMEGTGVYHEQAALALQNAGVVVSIANPAQVKDFGKGLAVRTKNDGVDSWVLARYGELLKPVAWVPPSLEARKLQALLARREAITTDLQREQNRMEKAEATDTPLPVRDSLITSIAFLKEQLSKLQQEIDDHIDQNPDMKKDFKLLESIPAVGQKTASKMLSVMYAHHFSSAEQLAAYLGLVPIERQSGSSVRGKPRLSKAGPSHMRATLYMAAIVATQYNPHVRDLYQRLLARGKSKMAAIGAAMRKLVHLCFGVIKSQTPYQPGFRMS